MCVKAGQLTDTPHSVDVVFRAVRQRHVDDIGQTGNVNAACCHICTDQEADVPILEGLHQPPHGTEHMIINLKSLQLSFLFHQEQEEEVQGHFPQMMS